MIMSDPKSLGDQEQCTSLITTPALFQTASRSSTAPGLVTQASIGGRFQALAARKPDTLNGIRQQDARSGTRSPYFVNRASLTRLGYTRFSTGPLLSKNT